ncbi:toll/interleukin-1 receptor domain-containing protein [Legionella bozemanae]|nr:toll/interleukin-1 receptor domain-containing protein [Legionella bozemanae]
MLYISKEYSEFFPSHIPLDIVDDLLMKLDNICKTLRDKEETEVKPYIKNKWIMSFPLADNIRERLDQVLYSLNKSMLTKNKLPPSVFISYAWPFPDKIKEEFWMHNFILILANDLKKAGVLVFVDFQHSRWGHRIQSHISRIKECDAVILLGTSSLKSKYENPDFHMVQDELSEIIHSHKPVIPILLTGDFFESFPRAIVRNLAIEDWREESYIAHLKDLLQHLYSPNSKAYKTLWDSLLQFVQTQFQNKASVNLSGQRLGTLISSSSFQSKEKAKTYKETTSVTIRKTDDQMDKQADLFHEKQRFFRLPPLQEKNNPYRLPQINLKLK